MKHDTTLRRFSSLIPSGRGVVISNLSPAYRAGNSIFPSRVFDPNEVGRVLKDGHQSRKIGREVRKGHRKGWPIFTLTLEERATCPRTCREWGTCYGNNMQAAERIVHGDSRIIALEAELHALARKYPGGFMVRLHVLGDFYSLEYVEFWGKMLEKLPPLHVFGFTARLPGTEIGDALWDIAGNQWDRFAVRFSGMPGERWASQMIPDEDPMSILCPAQTGATDCCATCALCWHSDRSIAFRRH
jgi:hypothetical protein